MNLVLKNKAAENVTFTPVGTTGNSMVYEDRTGPLMGRKRVTLSLNEKANTNRVAVKISLPAVCASDAETCGVDAIKYTQVASADITVVKFATEADREDLAALFASLIGSSALEDLVVQASMPV